MAKGTLLTNYVDDILNASMNGKRKYNLIQNDDGTVSLEDVTTYDQIGSDFSSAIVNAICKAVNESADKNKILETLDEVVATTKSGYIPDALALKEVNSSLNYMNNKIGTYINPSDVQNLINIDTGVYLFNGWAAYTNHKPFNNAWGIWIKTANDDASQVYEVVINCSTGKLFVSENYNDFVVPE